MGKAKHAPEPWDVKENTIIRRSFYDANDHEIGLMLTVHPNYEANKSLLLAAPELLAAAKVLRDKFYEGRMLQKHMTACEHAIAKAEGEAHG